VLSTERVDAGPASAAHIFLLEMAAGVLALDDFRTLLHSRLYEVRCSGISTYSRMISFPLRKISGICSNINLNFFNFAKTVKSVLFAASCARL
jgi:hypothetical protein